MAYRKPGVTVTQEFVGLVPALAGFTLPCVTVGPAYQLVSGDSLGTYEATDQLYAYSSLLGGAAVDLALADPDEVYPATKRPVAVTLKNAYAEIVPSTATGAAAGTAFSDATGTPFADVLPGDILVVEPVVGIEIIAAQTDGQSFMASGQRNRLQAGTPGQFANVKVGDAVTVTGASPTIAGTVLVTAIAPGDVLLLDDDINDGTADSLAVNYSIAGDRGTAGTTIIKTVTDENNLVLQGTLTTEAPVTYSVKRKLSNVVLTPLASPGNGFTYDASGITLPAVLTVDIGANTYDLIAGDVYADYRALRTDLAADVFEITEIADITAKFGVNQVDPANPLAYGLSLMLQNTVTAVNGLGLDENAVADEVLSFTNSLDPLTRSTMYAIAVLSSSPVVHTLFKSHVEGLSAPDKKLERVAIVNSLLQTRALLQEESTTVTTLANSRIIVNTQLDGSAAFTSPTVLNDATSSQFLNVQPGDSVVIQSGTNITPGTYPVASKQSNNQLTVVGSFITSGTATDVQYYIVRKDGLGADGMTFYDRNAAFISNGVAAGYYVTISSGSFAGRYKIGSVNSDTELVLATAVAGVATLQTALTYQVDRDLSRTEQAVLVGGYSHSLGSRRMVHVWPDVLQVPKGQSIVDVPGYFAACAIAALTTGLPTHQGFTNLSLSGFLGFNHSTRYFSEEQLDTIADGGTMILAQDGPQQALFVRHQLTTDRSAIKFQEFSVTKNVDFIAKFLRTSFAGYVGRYNIVDTTLDELKTNAASCISFLKDKTILPRIGGVIRSGQLASLVEDPTQIDTVLMRFVMNIPIPLNNLDITLQV